MPILDFRRTISFFASLGASRVRSTKLYFLHDPAVQISDRPFPPRSSFVYRGYRAAVHCISSCIDGKLGSGDKSSRSSSYLVVVVSRCCTGC